MIEGMLNYVADGADKYRGAVAQGYDAKREQNPKWVVEQAIIEDMLRDLPQGSWILDIPCGTGRFFDFYRRKGFMVRAVDKSEDMIQVAYQKAQEAKNIRFGLGDVRNLDGMQDKSNDATVMCRLTRWLSPEDCQQAMRELQRVTRKRIIFTARVRNHQHARPLGLFEAVLDGWQVTRNEEGYHPDYRIVMLEPTEAA